MTERAFSFGEMGDGAPCLRAPLALVRRGRRLAVVEEVPPALPPERIARAAYALALAHAFEERLARGLVGDLADLARETGLSRARASGR